jgi:hypothetical protein
MTRPTLSTDTAPPCTAADRTYALTTTATPS